VCEHTPAPEPFPEITLARAPKPGIELARPDFSEPSIVAGSPPVEAKDAASFCQKGRLMKWGSG
jgi:hypothetical protein